MKKIPLSNGMFAVVDDADYDFLNQWKWYYHRCGYARRNGRKNDAHKEKYMHRLIMKTPDGYDTDHINDDKLNNQRDNLRVATKSQNHVKQKKRNGLTSSKFKGVSWNRRQKKWYSYVQISGKRVSIGYFRCENDAALAYNLMAATHHGQFARLNKAG